LNMDKANMNIQELTEQIKKDQPEREKELNFVPVIRTDADAFYSYLAN
ncbi:transporter, partial [Bacillus cereus]|nr:transporter [Bacillus cereus]